MNSGDEEPRQKPYLLVFYNSDKTKTAQSKALSTKRNLRTWAWDFCDEENLQADRVESIHVVESLGFGNRKQDSPFPLIQSDLLSG